MVPWQPWKHQTHLAHGSNTWAMDEFDVLMVDVLMVDMSKHNHNNQCQCMIYFGLSIFILLDICIDYNPRWMPSTKHQRTNNMQGCQPCKCQKTTTYNMQA
jgi:hypothetical protein